MLSQKARYALRALVELARADAKPLHPRGGQQRVNTTHRDGRISETQRTDTKWIFAGISITDSHASPAWRTTFNPKVLGSSPRRPMARCPFRRKDQPWFTDPPNRGSRALVQTPCKPRRRRAGPPPDWRPLPRGRGLNGRSGTSSCMPKTNSPTFGPARRLRRCTWEGG